MIDTNLKDKVIENFNGSLKDIKGDLLQLEQNIKNKEKLDFDARGRILDSTYTMEAAIYRAVIYNMNVDLATMRKELQNLNTTLNTLVNRGDHEFLKIVNYKIIALLTFTIDHA